MSLKAPESGITVRMYNSGFGDCFLLVFRAEDGSPLYMLIDCGVHHQYPNGQGLMQLIIKDIAEATANHIHIVVVTHEHTDHLYGFKYGRNEFDSIEIDNLWLAWTEDPHDQIANKLKELKKIRIGALFAAAKQLSLSNEPDKQRLVNMIYSLPDFEPLDLYYYGGKADQIEYLREKSIKRPERSEDYLHPEMKPITIEDVKGVKIFVLGPPKNIDWIKKMERRNELYPKLNEMNEEIAFTTAVLTATGYEKDEQLRQQWRRSRPFDYEYGLVRNEALSHPEYGHFFEQFYGFSDEVKHGPEWRRIDSDWLTTAEQLALDIDYKTNNTSLVLAIELSETRHHKVLLFAADAQVGNWLSWHQLEWSGEGRNGETVTVADLLQRTVLYKVGHHGSRNATLRKKGLEMMKSADLVAMLPVDQRWANERNWEHPAEKLLDRLMEKTRGRIIRTDYIPWSNEPPEKPDEATVNEWQAFIKRLDWDRSPNRLWIQYTVPGGT